ncbi:unnamed protein product, partial [Symbiodinium sp. KB8]
AQIQPFNPALGADHKRKWESTPDAWTDYWQIARQNNEDDEWRVQCPAGARDEGIVPVLHTPDEDAVSKFADETLASFQVPRSMLEAVLRAMMQAGVTCPRVDGVPGIFQLRGEGWGHLVIPLVEQDTEAPLQSPMHREILESETHHFSFAHGTSQYALPMILMERIIRPQNYKKGSIPTVGPFGVASPGHLTMSPDCHTLKTVLKRSRLEAGTGEQLQISCRDAGVAIGPDAAVARSDLTYILGAFNKILSLLHAFSSFFDLASVLEDDENEGDSLRAVLAPKDCCLYIGHLFAGYQVELSFAGPILAGPNQKWAFCPWVEEDEALAVVSDDSDSDAEDTDMTPRLAMTSPVDSAPYFIQRAEEISLGRRVSDALKAKGVNTLAQLAFCVGQPGQVLASTEFDSWSEGILTDLTVGEKASLRRLILEAQTMLVASLKDMTESSEGATPKKVGVAERNARMDQLRTQLAGVSLTGPLEPSHALLDLAVQQWETRCLRYIGPEKCHSREDEVQNIKPVSTSLSVEGGKIKVTEDSSVEDRDIEGSLQVLNALRRRGVAYAFARLISWDKHEAYVSSLFKYLMKPAQPGYRKVSLRQILRADKLAFSKMSEAGEDIRADASGVCPLDDMISNILRDYDLIVSLLPLGDLE